jgi:methyltransferase (TIGR00027 family)
MRAAHTRCDRPRLIDDPWGDRLVSDAEKDALCRRALDGASSETRKRLEQLGSSQAIVDRVLRAHAAYGSVILRSRYAEDALAGAVACGARQYVLIGAGLDSFVVRQPAFARDVDIFEIDHPATQAMKRQRLAQCGVKPAPNVHFVAADLRRESLACVLDRCAFSAAAPAFFSWLGVTVYLSRADNLATLRGVATSSAPGSEIVFTYIEQRALEEQGSARLERMRTSVATQGEPWRSGFDPSTLADELRALGLTLVEDLGARQLEERYCSGRSDGLSAGIAGHVVRARISATRGA